MHGCKAKVDVLIENGTVVTVDPQRRVIRKGAVAIAKNRIMDVGRLPPSGENTRPNGPMTPP